jgi:hypothetical protein
MLERARQSLAEKRRAIETDLGGASALSTVQRDAVERLIEVDLMAQSLAAELLVSGIFTHRGKVRSAFAAFLQLLDRWQRLAVLVGVERRAKPIDLAHLLSRRQRPQDSSGALASPAITPDTGDALEAGPDGDATSSSGGLT